MIYIWNDGTKLDCSALNLRRKIRKRRRKRNRNQSNCREVNWMNWVYTHCQRRHWSMPMFCHCMNYGWNTFSIICGCISQRWMTSILCPTFTTVIMMHSVRRWSSPIWMVQKWQWLRRAMHRWLAKQELWRWRPKIHLKLSDWIIASEVSENRIQICRNSHVTEVLLSFLAIPKTESVFKLQIKDIEFKIYGKYLNIRPAERAVKKIKNFMEPDLWRVENKEPIISSYFAFISFCLVLIE